MKILIQSLLVFLLFVSLPSFAQVPAYSSFPGASAVLFLDFDGHTVNGTSWNSNGPIVCGPANMDNAKITEIYNRIAEDYRPFNINVTTDSLKYEAAPATKRMRAIFTITNSWYGTSAGGVAYIGSFTWGDNTPCFIFTALFKYNVKNIAEAGAHELGHTLGLRHQATYDATCAKIQEYNSGVGTGETSWAPIMGVGYYKNLTSWHNGADPYGCSSTQDDFTIISGSNNGFGLRTDDYSGTTKNLPLQSFTNNQFTTKGLIHSASDKDVIKFSIATTKRFELKAIPTNVGAGDAGSNLDLQIGLLDSRGKVLGIYNPPTVLNAALDTMLEPGTYFIEVDGVGNQYTSDYGSLGSYSITAIQSDPIILPVHKLELKGSTENNRHQLNWVIEADEAIVNQTLEVSADGRTFNKVAQLDAAERGFNYLPAATSALQYRLNVSFDNGRQHYSNIVALRNGVILKPQLFNNLIRTNAIMVNSPAQFSYAVSDYSGRILAKGTVTKGASSINLGNITNGTYIIQFANGKDIFVEKFVKQ